jgi:hypothetical protein
MKNRRGWVARTPDSDTRESFGSVWIVQAKEARRVVPVEFDALTVAVEVPR